MPEAQLMLCLWPDRSERVDLREVLVRQREFRVDSAHLQLMEKMFENSALRARCGTLVSLDEKVRERNAGAFSTSDS